MNNKEILGWLAIQAALMNEDNWNLQKFIRDNKLSIAWNNKPQVVFQILSECVVNIELRKALQKTFGQFDGAQICLNCGKVMFEGYSWEGDAYCSLNCLVLGKKIFLSEIERRLKDTNTDDGKYCYTEWD